MKRIILLSGLVLLIMNLLFFAVLSSYGGYNATASCIVIAVTGVLLCLVDTVCLKDAYKVSLMLLFTIGGAIEFVLSLVAPNRFEDNWWLIVVIGMLALETILLIVMRAVSKLLK